MLCQTIECFWTVAKAQFNSHSVDCFVPNILLFSLLLLLTRVLYFSFDLFSLRRQRRWERPPMYLFVHTKLCKYLFSFVLAIRTQRLYAWSQYGVLCLHSIMCIILTVFALWMRFFLLLQWHLSVHESLVYSFWTSTWSAVVSNMSAGVVVHATTRLVLPDSRSRFARHLYGKFKCMAAKRFALVVKGYDIDRKTEFIYSKS